MPRRTLRGPLHPLTNRVRDPIPAALAAVAAAVIVGLAAVVRLAALSSQPGGLYPDEGAEGLDAFRLLHVAGYHPLFFVDDGGREAPYVYLVAAAFRVAGSSIVVLRGVSGVIGVLAVAALYPALRRFSRGAALGGMAWAAGSLWLICISRDGLRNVLVLFLGALLIWSLVNWADHPGPRTAVVAGLASAAGLWSYQPLKLTPVLVALWLAWLRTADPERFRAMRGGLHWFISAYVVVASPLLFVAVTDPYHYFGRIVGVSPLNPVNWDIGIAQHALVTLGMFLFTGDPNGRHNVGSLPLLGPLLFILLAAGAWRAWVSRGDAGHALLLLGIPVFLVPPLLGVDGDAPHFLRSVGLGPFLAGLIGLGCVQLIESARQRWRRPGTVPVAAGVLSLMLVGLGAASAHAYFGRPVADRYHFYSFDVVALAEAAGGDDAVIVGAYNKFDVQFIDAADPPAILTSSAALPTPSRYAHIFSLRRSDLVRAVGPTIAAGARVVARGPDGSPTVWEVTL